MRDDSVEALKHRDTTEVGAARFIFQDMSNKQFAGRIQVDKDRVLCGVARAAGGHQLDLSCEL